MKSLVKDAELIKKLLPFESRFLDVAGKRMHYLDEGQGPVVLLLHGNPTWCFYYRHLITRLKANFRVIAPDFIGCGLSDHPENDHYRASDRIQQLSEFIDRLGLKKYSLVMHDWGGSIGTGHAIRFPERIERIVYLNTTLTETESLPLLIKTAARPVIGKFLTRHTTRFLKFTTHLGVGRKLPKDTIKGYYYPYRTRKRRNAIWDFVADIPFDSAHPSYSDMLDLARGIPKLTDIPVQIVWGLKDPCFHREMLNKVAEHFPRASILEIPEASHLVLEDAQELACSTIERFLKGESAVHLPVASSRVNALYQAFLETAQRYPENDAVVAPSFLSDSVKYAKLTYKDLTALISKYERGLSELGLMRGDKVLMLVKPGIDFLALSYAVMGRGAVPVFLDPGMGREKLFRCIKELRPDVLIGSPLAQVLRWVKKDLFSSIKFHVVAAEFFGMLGPDLSYLKRFASRPMPTVPGTGQALIAFTSGATGTPKGVIFSDSMIQAQLQIFTDVLGLKAGEKDLPLLPIFSLFNLAIGVGSVFPPLNPSRPLTVDSARVLRLIADHQIRYSFGSPTLWKKIGEYCVRTRSNLGSIEKILVAGAPVPRETLVLLKSVLKQGDIFTPYGATEALPVTLISATDILNTPEVPAETGEQGTLVGRPIAGVELKIIAPQDGPIPGEEEMFECAPLEIGEVIVRGANVSQEYFERTDANQRGKISASSGQWHRMGDLAYQDRQGLLYFCGRKVHAVHTAERIYFSVPVERIFNTHAKVARSALIDLGGQAALAIEPHPQFWPESETEREHFIAELLSIARAHPLTERIDRFFFHQSFPVDGRHNAKIFRDQLSLWAKKRSQIKKAA